MREDPHQRACRRCDADLTTVPASSRENICIDCRRERGREHYSGNRSYYLAKAKKATKRNQVSVRSWVLGYLQEHPCVDCGVTDTRVLQFDHLDPADKRAAVSTLVSDGHSLATVRAEIEKCSVRCANCHLIRTRLQFGWYASS